MAKTNHNQFSSQLSLGKFGDLLFTRQTRLLNAETHPSIVSAITSSFSAWRAKRAAMAELSGLSDRELADIGITRQQIPNVVRVAR